MTVADRRAAETPDERLAFALRRFLRRHKNVPAYLSDAARAWLVDRAGRDPQP